MSSIRILLLLSALMAGLSQAWRTGTANLGSNVDGEKCL